MVDSLILALATVTVRICGLWVGLELENSHIGTRGTTFKYGESLFEISI